MSKQDILDYFSDINYAYNDSARLDTLSRMLDELVEQAASPWHRVEEPQKEHGPFLCAGKTKRNGQTHWFFELCWYADGDLRDVVWDAKQESGFYSWNASQDRYIDRTVDYWMPIAPPKEDA